MQYRFFEGPSPTSVTSRCRSRPVPRVPNRQLGFEAIDFAARLDSDAVNLCVELVDAGVETGDVIFRRHLV
jgi:hypothetical protein